MKKNINQITGIVEAELKVIKREAGIFLFLMFMPFVFSLLSYGVGMALTGGEVAPSLWFYQLIGFTILVMAQAMSSSSAWYFRRGMMTGRLEYMLAAPVSPLVAVLSSALANMVFNIGYFVLVAAIGVVLVFGLQQLLNILTVILFLGVALIPIIGFNLIVGVSTIIFREPEPITNVINSIISSVSGFTYPLILLPRLLQLVGVALPYSHIVNTARDILAGAFQPVSLYPYPFLLGYLVLGLIIYRAGEVQYARKRGIHW